MYFRGRTMRPFFQTMKEKGDDSKSSELKYESCQTACTCRECISYGLHGEKYPGGDTGHRRLSVSYTHLAPDLNTAKAYISVLGDEKSQQDTIAGLRSAEGLSLIHI